MTCPLGTLPLATPAYGAVDVLLRPEALNVQPDPHGSACMGDVRFFGTYQCVWLHLSDGTRIAAHLPPQQVLPTDTPFTVAVRGAVMVYPTT